MNISGMARLLVGLLPCAGVALASSDDHEHELQTVMQGPNGGRLLESDGLVLELAIVESGLPPEFRAWTRLNGEPLPPDDVTLTVQVRRLAGDVEQFEFLPELGYLRGIGRLEEPHSFDVTVTAQARGRSAAWEFDSYEGRTVIPERVAREAGVETEIAGPRLIRESVMLTGTVQANPARLANVRPRFAGVVTQIDVDVDQRVRRGQQLAMLETNESLRRVPVTAPISGLVVNRNVQIGQVTGDQPLFTIADLGEVWVILDVFGSKLKRVRAGMPAEIQTLGGERIEGVVDHVSALMSHGSQSAHARLIVPNEDGSLRAGQFVQGRVITSQLEVPLAVRRDALQTFRDADAVFLRLGDTYEARPLELGRHDEVYVEVLGGLRPGDEYVISNSYLVKADIEKSGASHDH